MCQPRLTGSVDVQAQAARDGEDALSAEVMAEMESLAEGLMAKQVDVEAIMQEATATASQPTSEPAPAPEPAAKCQVVRGDW